MESKKNIPKGDFKIGQRVKTLREGQSLTQKELADMVAISPSSIARLESGETMTVRGKVILQSQGKEFFTWHGKDFFT